MNIYLYFLLFLIYSFIGWTIEVINVSIIEKRFVNRGFLMGPYCPIYGFGGISCYLLLRKYLSDPIALFMMSILIFSILEYMTSYIMEKLFKARWWDYSDKKFNINGRICLETMVPFGLLGCFAMYVLNPGLIGLLEKIPANIAMIISIILFVLFMIDCCISFKIIINFKNVAFSIKKDSTEEITRRVREKLSKESVLTRRLVNAFSKLQVIKRRKND